MPHTKTKPVLTGQQDTKQFGIVEAKESALHGNHIKKEKREAEYRAKSAGQLQQVGVDSGPASWQFYIVLGAIGAGVLGMLLKVLGIF